MRRFAQFVLLAVLLVTSAGTLFAQAKAKRLVMKDGTYQLVTKYEVKGDRVRYYSAERMDWEEVPASLVDWNATNSQVQKSVAVDQEAAKEEAEERQRDEARSPQILPGLKLPDTGGMFLLDTYSGQPQLVELMQSGADINKQMGKNILRAVINPLPTGVKQTIELKGPHARVQAHAPQPTIYVNINYDQDEDSPDAGGAKVSNDDQRTFVKLEDRFKIVRVQSKANARVVGNLKIRLTGSTKEERNVVDARAQSISTDWLKLTPAVPLVTGEYALVEMLSPTQMNLYVWDFGVNPSAPANPSAWKPAPVKKTQTGTNESPVLRKH
jgi:hypothetical protein